MQRLDRLGWVAGISFIANGVRIGIRTNQYEILEKLKNHFPFGWKLSSSTVVDVLYSLKIGGQGKRSGLRQFHLVYVNFIQLIRTHNLEDAFETLESSVQLYAAEHSHRRVFVHAGVVGWQGKALIITGYTCTGKSTLVRELVKAGAIYLSDEYAVLDTRGRVHPYTTPIGVRIHPSQRQQKKYPIETFGGIVGTQPLEVGLILATEYKEGAHWRPKLIPAGQGLLAIMANTVSAQRYPAKALSTLQKVVLKAPVLKGVRGETDEVVDALLNRPWPTL